MRERQERNKFRESLHNSHLSEDQREKLETEYARKVSENRRLKRRTLKPTQFEKIKLIGRGAFGDVWLVRDVEDHNVYAMKMLRKSELVAKKQVLNTLSERDIMASDNPWSVQLIYSFQDQTYLYFVMEYLPGGDLMNLLIKRGYLREDEARFILAEILLAIQNVHLAGFIHRDVKPDNVLITRNGHIKLTDFGLSAKTERYADPYMTLIENVNDLLRNQRNSSPNMPVLPQPQTRRAALCSTVGTPDYIAPEVLLKKPYDYKVDFWSFGCVMYEMLFGSPPFFAKTARQTAINIVKWRETLKFPRKPPVSMAAIDLIRHLLCGKDHRMGFEEIKSHAFFAGVDFDTLLQQQPPIVPDVQTDADTSNFDEFEPREEVHDADESSVMNLAFMGFKYNRHIKTRTLPSMMLEMQPILHEKVPSNSPSPIPKPGGLNIKEKHDQNQSRSSYQPFSFQYSNKFFDQLPNLSSTTQIPGPNSNNQLPNQQNNSQFTNKESNAQPPNPFFNIQMQNQFSNQVFAMKTPDPTNVITPPSNVFNIQSSNQISNPLISGNTFNINGQPLGQQAQPGLSNSQPSDQMFNPFYSNQLFQLQPSQQLINPQFTNPPNISPNQLNFQISNPPPGDNPSNELPSSSGHNDPTSELPSKGQEQ